MIKKIRIITLQNFLLIFILSCIPVCSGLFSPVAVIGAEKYKTISKGQTTSSNAPNSGRLVLLHTNDHHGHLLPGTDDLGGMARLSSLIKRLRAQYQNSPNQNDPNKNDQNKNDQNKNDQNKNDQNKNDQNKNDQNKNDQNKNDQNKNDQNKNDQKNQASFPPWQTSSFQSESQNHNVITSLENNGTKLTETGNTSVSQSRLSKREMTTGLEFSDKNNVLLVDAGDINTGTPLSDFFEARPDFLIYNYLGYDFATFGNHEFDISLDRLSRQIEQANFPFVSSNVMLSDGRFLGVPWVILNYDFGRIGFIGITVSSEKIIIQKDHGFRIAPEIETARKTVDFLKKEKKVDLIIALTHLGFTTSVSNAVLSLELAKQVPEINVIIDGHSHTKIDSPRYVGKTILVTANCYGRYLGALVLDLTKGKITHSNWTCHPIDRSLPEDPEIKKILAPFQKKTESELDKIVTTTAEEFSHDGYPCRFREVALGDMICDGIVKTLTQKKLPVDFAFITGGNIRAELPKGDVTLENILEILPFRNRIWRLTLKGSDLSEFFATVASARPGFASFAQISAGVQYKLTYPKSGPGAVSDLRINGKEIEPDRLYRIGTIDFLAQGGDGYDVLLKRIRTDITNVLLYESFADYLRSLPVPIHPVTESRITIRKKD